MNNRRQTIWLVSMLSLMVILSAYYLFTEDASPAGQTADQASGYTQDAGATDDGVQITQVDGTDGAEATDGAAPSEDADASADGTDAGSDAAAAPDASAPAADGNDQEQSSADPSASPDDEAVLSNLNNQKGRAYFDNIELQRRTKVSEEEERLNNIIADTTNNTQDQAAAAIEDLHRLDATEERISSLEEKLLATYENAVVEQDNDNFKVVVQADKLNKAQAVSIVETATKELQVTPDRVTVQYIANP